jgi:hypothetical protein
LIVIEELAGRVTAPERMQMGGTDCEQTPLGKRGVPQQSKMAGVVVVIGVVVVVGSVTVTDWVHCAVREHPLVAVYVTATVLEHVRGSAGLREKVTDWPHGSLKFGVSVRAAPHATVVAAGHVMLGTKLVTLMDWEQVCPHGDRNNLEMDPQFVAPLVSVNVQVLPK